MKPNNQILVVGDANVDLVGLTPGYPAEGDDVGLSDLQWVSGGAGVNVAAALAWLGAPTRFLTRVGRDLAAESALAAARAAGVDLAPVQVDPHLATGLCFVAVSPGGARTFFSFRGANVALTAPPATLFDQVAWLHVAGHALLEGRQRDTTLDLIDQANQRGIGVPLDLCPPLVRVHGAEITALLPQFTIVFGNEEEVGALSIAAPPPILVLKRGARGCLTLAAAERIDLAALPVAALDTTGCGDAFVAGFLAAYRRELPLRRCALLANALGALVATVAGAAIPPRATIQTFLAAHGIEG